MSETTLHPLLQNLRTRVWEASTQYMQLLRRIDSQADTLDCSSLTAFRQTLVDDLSRVLSALDEYVNFLPPWDNDTPVVVEASVDESASVGVDFQKIEQEMDAEEKASDEEVAEPVKSPSWFTDLRKRKEERIQRKNQELIEKVNNLKKDQPAAWEKISTWLTRNDHNHPFFILSGRPGTGKTTLLSVLDTYCELNGRRVVFTAPTNKATKEIAKRVSGECRTTYAALGIRMRHDEDELKLSYKADRVPIDANTLLVVDECSMPNAELVDFIIKAQRDLNLRVLFVGDPAQLNPVGERHSKVWKLISPKDTDHYFLMKEVIRFKDALLKLSIRVRRHLSEKNWTNPLRHHLNDDQAGGVYMFDTRDEMLDEIFKLRKPQDYADTKVICWRNKTVNWYNQRIRENLGFTKPFEVGDQLMLAEPIEDKGVIVAYIDDEFEVRKVKRTVEHVKPLNVDVDVWRLTCRGDDGTRTLVIPVQESQLGDCLSILARAARSVPKEKQWQEWKTFWAVKGQFNSVRFAYACTAHRLQGSTLRRAFVDAKDVLANKNKPEAFRALMVAVTRSTDWVLSY